MWAFSGWAAVRSDRGGAVQLGLKLALELVGIEVVADDEAAAEETVRSLPMARWWTLDVFPTRVPPPPE